MTSFHYHENAPHGEEAIFDTDSNLDNVLPKLSMNEDEYVQAFDVIIDNDDSKAIEENKKEIQDFPNKYGTSVGYLFNISFVFY